MGSITGHRIEYNGVGATRDQQHKRSSVSNRDQDPVVRTRIGTNPGLNFNLGVGFFFFFSSKALFRIIFHILFGVSNYQIVGKEN